MTFEQLEKALMLQKQAYKMLRWLAGEAKASPELLDAETLSSSSSTERWVKRYLNRFPSEIRPALDDIESFAFALSSFLATSFHIKCVASGRTKTTKLVRGAKKFTDGRNKKHALQRAQKDAAELKRIALSSLVADEVIATDLLTQNSLLNDSVFAPALALWTYGCELVRRSEFASQGPAVHQLWLELSEKQRTHLNAESIWKARSQLVKALTKSPRTQVV